VSVDLESLLSGTSTTATPAAAQICCSGSRISSALVLVSFLSSSSDARSVCSLNSASSRSLATTSASRTHAATASSRVLNACVWRYATAHAFQTAFQLSGEATPKKFRRVSRFGTPFPQREAEFFHFVSRLTRNWYFGGGRKLHAASEVWFASSAEPAGRQYSSRGAPVPPRTGRNY